MGIGGAGTVAPWCLDFVCYNCRLTIAEELDVNPDFTRRTSLRPCSLVLSLLGDSFSTLGSPGNLLEQRLLLSP